VKWAEVDIESGDLPSWQWESLIGQATRLVAVTSASGTLGTFTDLRPVTKLVHDVGGFLIVDHSAAAPYRLIDIDEIDADVVAINAVGWGGPPVGALVFRDPAMINTFASVSTNPYATGPERLEVGVHQYGLLGGFVATFVVIFIGGAVGGVDLGELLPLGARKQLDRLGEFEGQPGRFPDCGHSFPEPGPHLGVVRVAIN